MLGLQLLLDDSAHQECSMALPQKSGWRLDRVSTGSGSDLVSDQHAIFLMILDSYGLTRSLPLPVLTRSNNEF